MGYNKEKFLQFFYTYHENFNASDIELWGQCFTAYRASACCYWYYFYQVYHQPAWSEIVSKMLEFDQNINLPD